MTAITVRARDKADKYCLINVVISKTSLLATRALLYLAEDKQGKAASPRVIATRLGESQAYMAKVLRLLVRAGILRAERGMRGGVLLSRRPEEVTLLAIVEACQGAIVGSYCQGRHELRTTCAFHRAAAELQQSIMDVLARWNLEQLARFPAPAKRRLGEMPCMVTTFPISIAGQKHRNVARRQNAVT